MILEPPPLTIRRGFPRPSAAQIAAFAGIPTGYAVDAMGGRGGLDHRIKPIGAPTPFLGVAVTCDAGAADNLACFGAIEAAVAGDVVICAADGFAATAVVGDLMLGMMKNRGIVAFVTDGMVRDLVGIRAVGLPCYAAGITPNSPACHGPATAGLPISVGGVAVSSGDIVLGDEDGVVVVPFARLDETIARLAEVKQAEAALDAKVKAGLVLPDWVRERIEAREFKLVD